MLSNKIKKMDAKRETSINIHKHVFLEWRSLNQGMQKPTYISYFGSERHETYAFQN
jgi:hypothetical protein